MQANVPGLYDTSTGPVPWIGPIKDSPYGFGKGAKGPFGVYGSPAVGSQIKVELQKGDDHNALYTPLPTVPSANPAFASPQTWGFQDPSGNQLLVDMTAGSWTFSHSSGDIVQYLTNGDRLVLIKGTDNLTVDQDLKTNILGDESRLVNKTMTIIVKGNCVVQSDTRVDIQAPITTINSVPPLPF